MISQERLLNVFLTLVQIDSPSGQEAAISAELADRLRALDMDVTVDKVGNILSRWESEGQYLLLNAHMDTVPGTGIKPIVKDGIVRSDGTTILGGDDKSGVAVILEVLTTLREQGRRPAIEVAFTVSEEIGLIGAKELDTSWFRAGQALVLDAGGPLNEIVHGAPGSDKIDAIIHGRAVHSGTNPEAGINAIAIAAKAIAQMQLGRIDEETTANIGTIRGGQAVNIVPDRVEMHGETRSHDQAKLDAQTDAMRRALEDTVAAYEGAKLDLEIKRTYEAYRLDINSPLIRRIVTALEAMDEKEPTFRVSGGGSDANVFNAQGISAVPISTGIQDAHTNNESIAIADMVRCAEFVLQVI